ncbi:phosphatase PAP2 family protein [Streptomyces sp. NPDC003656]
MTPTYDGSPLDGAAYEHVVRLARHAPGRLDDIISVWSSYGLGVFALLMTVAWWRARRADAGAAGLALAVPVVTVVAYCLDLVLKSVVREDRPCRTLHVRTLEACPAPGDWSFPSNHAVIAASAAVALLFVSRRLGAVAVVAALAMGASRVWVGVHYPHDVLAGLLVGALVAALAMRALRRRSAAVAGRLTTSRLGAFLLTP